MPSKPSLKSAPPAGLRVVLDTNVLVSGSLVGKGPSGRILRAAREGEFQILVCPAIIAEYQEAMARPHIRRKYPLAVHVVPAVVEFLEVMAEMVFPSHIEPVIAEDPDDDVLLACALEGQADFIISGDSHLKALGRYRGVKILTPREFVARFLSGLDEA